MAQCPGFTIRWSLFAHFSESQDLSGVADTLDAIFDDILVDLRPSTRASNMNFPGVVSADLSGVADTLDAIFDDILVDLRPYRGCSVDVHPALLSIRNRSNLKLGARSRVS